ncbi:MAG: ribonuclease HII [Anaerolineales bacterium]|nr:ribonuclease HII [Anaerolineales bacterium]
MTKSVPTLRYERRFARRGLPLVAGLDEVGRGAWAGPVVAAAVILPLDQPRLARALRGVTDSKQLTARQRERLCGVIAAAAVAIGVGGAGPGEVDRDGLTAATHAAMQRAVAMLRPAPDALLIDAVDLSAVVPLPQAAVLFGDARCLSIAAASILAKVSRDRWMAGLDQRCPGYAFARHKGYGTAAHRAALAALGPCEAHRRSFAPLQALASAAGG